MKVLFWGNSPCIRTYKEAKALRSHGIETVLVYGSKAIDQRYPGLKAEDAFSKAIKSSQVYPYHFVEDEKIDIIHTAHPPDETVRYLLGCGLPIVHDFHDLYSLERDELYHLRTEADAAQFASGLVFVSERMASCVSGKYPSRAVMDCVLANAAEDHPVTPRPKPWPQNEIHVVYVAAMPRWNEHHFRDMKGLVEQVTGQGIHLHVYAIIVKPELKKATEENPLFHLEAPAVGREKIELLTRFDAAVWFRRPDIPKRMQDILDLCSPNKIYEYWQAKIPIVCCGGKAPEKLITDYQLGWNVKDFSNLQSVLAQEYKPNCDVITMKEEVKKLIALYEDIIWR